MYGDYNEKKEINEKYISSLIKKGYIELGWANSGAKFNNIDSEKESIDCSLYVNRGTKMCYIDNTSKEILYVDMGD